MAPRIRFLKKQQAAGQGTTGKTAPPPSAAPASGSAEDQDSGIDESRQAAADGKPYRPLFRTAYSFHDSEEGSEGYHTRT